MKVYNKDKTQVLENYDLSKGYLKNDIIDLPEVKGIEEQGHWETIAEYPETGGKDVEWVVDVAGVEYKPARTEKIRVYIPYTEQELIDMQKENEKQQRIYEIQTRLNELSQDFIQIQCGAVFDDAEQRKAEFKTLHNELRLLLGKKAREYENNIFIGGK